jgi:toxin ParE1/3/4
VTALYRLRPKADYDIDQQALYLSTKGSPRLGHQFLLAAHESFSLLAQQPGIGWHPRLEHPDLRDLRVFRIRKFERMLVLYRPIPAGIEIVRVIHASRNLLKLLESQGLW